MGMRMSDEAEYLYGTAEHAFFSGKSLLSGENNCKEYQKDVIRVTIG